MNQSNVIFAVLFLGFIVFVTMRGKLPAYLEVLVGGGQGGGNRAAQSGGGGGGGVASSLFGSALGMIMGQ